MTIDGFLQFLGILIAVYALFSIVVRHRLRLLGWLLWLPSTATLIIVVYLLLFDVVGIRCGPGWCSSFELSEVKGLTPNKLAFLFVLAWIGYVAALSRRTSIPKRKLPLLASLIDRLVAEKRFPELVDFVEPHIDLISQCAGRQVWLRKLRDRIRFYGNPFLALAQAPEAQKTRWERTKQIVMARPMSALKRLEARMPETSRKEEAAQKILRVLHTNDSLVKFLALERPLVALKLMHTRANDYDFSDRAFEIMMAHGQSQLRRETFLNQNVGLCFYEIDDKNPLIHALFADAKVAEKLEIYRPVGNYPLQLLERDVDNYRQSISAAKPRDDRLIERDPTYCMIRFFDLMIRSAMKEGIEWHMWLFYFDILVDKLLKSMDVTHPDFDSTAEFPNFGYYLIYEIFSTYGDWLRIVECCPEGSTAVRIENTAPVHDNGSIFKSTILSIGNSLKYLVRNDSTPDQFISYLMGMLMRDYRDLAARKNGGVRAQEALRNSILAGGYYGLEQLYIARLGDGYADIDPLLQFETKSFRDALEAALK